MNAELNTDAAVAEMSKALADHPGVTLHLTGVDEWALISVLQLALRHPRLPTFVRGRMGQLRDHLIEGFIECVTPQCGATPERIRAFLEAGDDPRYDVHPGAEPVAPAPTRRRHSAPDFES